MPEKIDEVKIEKKLMGIDIVPKDGKFLIVKIFEDGTEVEEDPDILIEPDRPEKLKILRQELQEKYGEDVKI